MSASGRCAALILAAASLADGAAVRAAQPVGHADHALGRVDFPVSCSQPAQVQFNHAVALLHHMTYPQARAVFEAVAATDPHCAMAQWGIAASLFYPLWPTRPGPADLARGWAAVQRAEALDAPTERERLFISTAEAFFRDPASADYWLRIRRWAEASRRLYESAPQDPEAGAFYALALLATAPADKVSRANADRAAAILLRIYERNPDHPGAMHYLVHANDMPGREHELLDVTRRYARLAPRNPHALHMPTHIFTRLGDWDGVIGGNLRAADAALEHPAGEHGEFVWDEFPHAIEYLVYAYLQQGADDEAARQWQRLSATAHLEPTFKTAFHLSSIPARVALERHAWSEAAALVPRVPATLEWERYPWPEAITQFARGLGAAHLRQFDEARRAGERLAQLERTTRESGEELFAQGIHVLVLELNAWTAYAAGQPASGIALMREAAELEASTPKHAVTPGPTLPAHELLGDLYLDMGRPSDALSAYRRAMELYPRRFNSLLGAARAARALGDVTQARDHYAQLLEVAAHGTRQGALEEAREFVAQR